MAKRIAACTVLAVIVLMLLCAGTALAAKKWYRGTTNYIEPLACMQLHKDFEKQCMVELYQIGIRYLNEKKYDQAIVRFTQILSMQEFGLVYSNRGTAYAMKGDYKRARPDVARALDLNPTQPENWYNLARIDYELKRYEGALDSANVAIDLAPDKADFHDLRAMIHKAMKHEKRAAADTARALEIRDADEKKILSDRALKKE